MEQSPPVQYLGVLLEMATESVGDTDRGAESVRTPGLLSSLSCLHQGCRNCRGRDPDAGHQLLEGAERRPCLCTSSSRTEQGRWLKCLLGQGKLQAGPEVADLGVLVTPTCGPAPPPFQVDPQGVKWLPFVSVKYSVAHSLCKMPLQDAIRTVAA